MAQQVDLVISNHTFEHIADLHDVMDGVLKILKPGGYIFTVVPTYYKNRSSTSVQGMGVAHNSMFNHHSLNQLFAGYGLTEVAHTYRGWDKEIDDFWHLAKLTGEKHDPREFYENPRKVVAYVNFINPINTIVNYPRYSNYPERVQRRLQPSRAKHLLRMLVKEPGVFVAKVVKRLTGRGGRA